MDTIKIGNLRLEYFFRIVDERVWEDTVLAGLCKTGRLMRRESSGNFCNENRL
jgi:hypothetical protein